MTEIDKKIIDTEDITALVEELQANGGIGEGTVGPQGPPGENGKDGRSIESIRTDENNDVYVTFSDGKEEKIGTLVIDVQADFLTENGFGKLRYYQGRFQYYDSDSSNWIDATVDPQNPYILQMIPNPMKFFVAQFDTISKKYRLRWDEPQDTILADQSAVIVEKVIIRRKKDSVPTGIADGEEVLTIERRDFHQNKSNWYVDEANTDTDEVSAETMWHYKAFPVATTGFANTSSKNEPIMDYKDYHLFGMTLDQNESNPDSMIQYIEDNKDYIPAHMDFDNDKFEYGSWKSFVDDILQVKPCLMESKKIADETLITLEPVVYLDPEDYTKTVDGEDRTSKYPENGKYETYIQFSKLYYIFHDNGDDTVNIYYSDKNLYYDEESNSLRKPLEGEEGSMYNYLFKNFTSVGNEYSEDYDYTWIGAYPLTPSNDSNYYKYGSFDNSLPAIDTLTNQESNIVSNFLLFSHMMFFYPLVVMLIRSTHLIEKYGQGHLIITYYNTDGTDRSTTSNWGTITDDADKTGGLDKKGLFYGGKGVKSPGVKIFGIEHYYGYTSFAVLGLAYDKGTIPMVKINGINHNRYGSKNEKIGEATLNLAVNNNSNAQYLRRLKFYPDMFLPIETTVEEGYTNSTYFCQTIYAHSNSNRCLAIYGSDNNCSPKETGFFAPTEPDISYATSSKYYFYRLAYIKISGV